jgi:hypothetical protein
MVISPSKSGDLAIKNQKINQPKFEFHQQKISLNQKSFANKKIH